jgi:hypothetical protein
MAVRRKGYKNNLSDCLWSWVSIKSGHPTPNINYREICKMKITTVEDCFFASAEKPKKNCQDYALSGHDPIPYLIIWMDVHHQDLLMLEQEL